MNIFARRRTIEMEPLVSWASLCLLSLSLSATVPAFGEPVLSELPRISATPTVKSPHCQSQSLVSEHAIGACGANKVRATDLTVFERAHSTTQSLPLLAMAMPTSTIAVPAVKSVGIAGGGSLNQPTSNNASLPQPLVSTPSSTDSNSSINSQNAPDPTTAVPAAKQIASMSPPASIENSDGTLNIAPNRTGTNSSPNGQSGDPQLRPAASTPGASSIDAKNSNSRVLKGNVYVPANPYRGVNNSSTPFAPEGSTRRGLPAPLDPVFPSTEYVGIASQGLIGVPDQDQVYPLERAIYKACPALARARIKIYGWINPGMDYSSSHHSNIPLSYAIVPRRVELDQAIFRIERVPDTVQTEHSDWGFRATVLYGIDYRWTAAEGWYPASSELLRRNRLYGLDPLELYGMWYTPKVAKGMVVKFGRFISPPDIEAQLAPDNYMWTHSQMFTVDCYTLTGALASIKLSDSWMVQLGVSAGNDQAPWARSAKPNGTALLRWQSRSNKDMIYGGVNTIGNGQYSMSGQHDNLQQFNLTWFHRFNRRFHIATEFYWIYEFNALRGGTVNNGPPYNFNALTGPGMFMPGMSNAYGLVSYWNYKVTDRDYLTLRPIDYLFDPNGVRTGFPTTMTEWSLGWCHRFSDLLCIRPEIRLDRSLSHVDVYDNGTRRFQFTFGFDVIQRF